MSNPARFCIKNARLIEPQMGLDVCWDVLVEHDKIGALGPNLPLPEGTTVVDAKGLWLMPGFIDLHAHVREPGQEYKEDIASASRSALSGGFSSICVMPNTAPTLDCASVLNHVKRRAQEVSGVRLYAIGAITLGLKGEQLSDIGDLKAGGVVALSDDGRCVMNAEIMRRALEYAKTFDLPVVQHAEDCSLSAGGVMNEGLISTQLGLRGQPNSAESVIVGRDIELVRLTKARYHVAHVSTKEALVYIRRAKEDGLPVTCEVTPHHLSLTDAACQSYNTATKVNPPLRRQDDVEALFEGLRDGTIDAIATDHAPHNTVEKAVEFDHAAFGMIGFETALGLMLRHVEQGRLNLMQMVSAMTYKPAAIFDLRACGLRVGAMADLTLVDPHQRWVYTPESVVSKSRNSPFLGQEFTGKVVATLVGGQIKYDPFGRFAYNDKRPPIHAQTA